MKKYYNYNVYTKNIDIFNELKHIGEKSKYKKNIIYSDKLEQKHIGIFVEADSPEYNRVKEIINSKEVEYYSYFIQRKFTKQEFLSYELYCMTYIFPWESDGINSEDFGTMYKYTSTPKCKHNRIQVSDLLLDMKKASKYKIATAMPEIFVNKEIKELLVENNITGIHFGRVRDYKNRDFPDYYQLFIDNVLPEMSDKIIYEFEESDKCSVCGRGGIYLKSELIYNRKDLNNICDFNLTNEYLFGPSVRLTVISKRVMSLLNEQRCKVGYSPVTILDN